MVFVCCDVRQDTRRKNMDLLVLELTNPEQREGALLELSKKREAFQDLAPILWHSFGTIAALLQEIVTIYPLLSPPQLTAHASNRVCNALALLQCVASHQETRSLFLAGETLVLCPAGRSSYAESRDARVWGGWLQAVGGTDVGARDAFRTSVRVPGG